MTPIKDGAEPFIIYSVSKGHIKEMTVTKETPTGYRLASGELYPKTPTELSGVWRHVNGRVASRASVVTDKSAAIELALKQNEAFREFLYQHLDSANEQHSLLKELKQVENNETQ